MPVDVDGIKIERVMHNALKSPDRFIVVCIQIDQKRTEVTVDLLEFAKEMNFSDIPSNYLTCTLLYYIQNTSV